MADPEEDLVEELLGMAKDPESFSKPRMAEAILVAATEIIKLREQQWNPAGRVLGKRANASNGAPLGERV